MLESELFALFEQTADAAYTVTAAGEICAWNRAAERLFGHPATTVIGRNVNEVLEASDALGTPALAGDSEAVIRGGGQHATDVIPSFDLEVRRRSGERIWVNMSTIVFDNRRTGRQLFVRLVRDITWSRGREELLHRMQELIGQLAALPIEEPQHAPVEKLTIQERHILKLFAAGRNSATIARTLDISAQTLRNHLHHINQKLRTHTRLEAVTHAQRRGLLD
ncbi:MAG: PAS domain S-box protein [Gemmatimonadota bacterium]